MNSYIHELLMYLCLQGFISGFESFLWLITAEWLQVALIALVPSCINFTQAFWVQVIAYLITCLMVMYSLDVVRDTPCIPSFNFMNNVFMNAAWTVRSVINSSNACSYPSCLFSLHVSTFHEMFAVWYLCFKQDQLIEWMTKGQAMVLRINILWYNEFGI